MIEQDELAGTIVLVRPDLLNDPANKKNQVGIITSADLENDNLVVSFSDRTEGLFSSDALLVLRDTAEIRRVADYDFSLLFKEDYCDIMEVCYLARLSAHNCRRAAVELSQKNWIAREYTMHPLTDELDLNRCKSVSR